MCHFVSLFVAGAAFGEVHVSLFVAGAACGEIWNDSRSGKRCNFQWNLLLASAKSSLGGAAGCGLRFLGRIMVGSWSDHGRMFSDHARIGRALEMPLQLFSVNFSKIWECNFAWQAQYLVRLEVDACCLGIVNDVSNVMCINHEIHFAWQAQYLVRLEGVDCCSAHCK